MTIQPDFGQEFTINYQFVNFANKPGHQALEGLPDNGARIYLTNYPNNGTYKFLPQLGLFSSVAPDKFEDVQSISEDYLSKCYIGWNGREKKQLAYIKDQGLVQIELPTPIQAALDKKPHNP